MTKVFKSKKSKVVNSKYQDAIDLIKQGVDSGDIPKTTIESVKSSLDRAYSKKLSSTEGHVFKARMDLDMGIQAYKRILEDGISPEEALNYVKELNNLTDQFIKECKNNNYHGKKKTSRAIVNAHNTHPRQKQMVKDGTIDKGSLSSASTPNQQLGRLQRQVLLNEKLLHLQKSIQNQEIRIDSILKVLDNNDIKVDKIELCKYLYNKGWSIAVLAEHYLVSKRTIQRWIR